MKVKKTVLLIFLLLSGMVLGALLATVCQGVPGLSWLAFSREVGISPDAPFVLNLSMLRFSFGLAFHFYVAQIITVGLAIVLYNVMTNKR